VLQALLPLSPSSIALTDTNHAKFQQARSALNQALRNEYRGRLFKLNSWYMMPPLILTFLSGVVALGFRSGPAIWITWLMLVAALHGLFIWLLRAPTVPGRQVMDEIEGFRMYLDTAEQDRLDRCAHLPHTEVFESFLPYAYALGVENHWCERFARELPNLEPGHQTTYQPAWYSGRYQGMGAIDHLSDRFSSSFSSAISSASSPPGSSSGSSGGGSSGGGGGGGGGGGW
jgi:uncharacterized membrane protein